MTLERETLLDEVIDREWTMFQATQNQGGTASCQQRPDTFRLMRWMFFSVMTVQYLESYLDDLKAAEVSGRNFMIEKYARMDNLITPVSDDMDTVARLADIEEQWMRDMSEQYPSTFPNSGDYFRRYLGAELETLSLKTLSLYEARVQEAQEKNENLTRVRYDNLSAKSGVGSLDEREAQTEQG